GVFVRRSAQGNDTYTRKGQSRGLRRLRCCRPAAVSGSQAHLQVAGPTAEAAASGNITQSRVDDSKPRDTNTEIERRSKRKRKRERDRDGKRYSRRVALKCHRHRHQHLQSPSPVPSSSGISNWVFDLNLNLHFSKSTNPLPDPFSAYGGGFLFCCDALLL
ncbi:Hypothetical predicted protein, partial [Drosophila guanche]